MSLLYTQAYDSQLTRAGAKQKPPLSWCTQRLLLCCMVAEKADVRCKIFFLVLHRNSTYFVFSLHFSSKIYISSTRSHLSSTSCLHHPQSYPQWRPHRHASSIIVTATASCLPQISCWHHGRPWAQVSWSAMLHYFA